MGFTEPSPKGRIIEHVEGNPSSIIARGEEITRLGRQMLDSADLLEQVATRSLEDGSQKGKAIEKLRDSIGDSYQTLRESGDLYEPVGPVITGYGNALDLYQPLINRSADECEDLYAKYITSPGDKNGSQSADEGGVLGIGSTSEEDAAENRAAQRAYEEWEAEARTYDYYYDSWELAFEDAANGIGDEMSGAIEDSFWSDVVDVLKVVGTIVAIAAMFTGIGALVWLGVGLGVALTAATAMQMANGEANWMDLGLAALSVIPAAKVTKFTGAGSAGILGGGRTGMTTFVRSMAPSQSPRALNIASDSVIGAWRSGGFSSTARYLATGNARGIAGITDDAIGTYGRSGVTARQFFRVDDLSTLQAGATGLGNLNSFNSWAGDLGLPNVDIPSWTGALV